MSATNEFLNDAATQADCILAVLAHPDDETFIAGTLKRHIEEGARVHGVWITSGEASGGRERREKELARAAAILGLEQNAIHLPHYPNRGLLPILAEVADWLGQTIEAIGPQRIYVPAYEGGHIDHDAVNWCVYTAWQKCLPEAACLEFPLYNRTGPRLLRGWRIGRFAPDTHGTATVHYTRLTPEHVRCKFSMMRAYKSQWTDLLPFRLAMPRRSLLTLGEQWAALPPGRDYSIPPHAGPLNYELNPGTFRFSDFAAAVHKAEEDAA